MANATYCDPPLLDSEAIAIALSAWNRHSRGRNSYMSQSLTIPVTAFNKLDGADGGDALRLLYHLERAHWDRDEFYLAKIPFAASLGWTPKRFLKARDLLVEAGCSSS